MFRIVRIFGVADTTHLKTEDIVQHCIRSQRFIGHYIYFPYIVLIFWVTRGTFKLMISKWWTNSINIGNTMGILMHKVATLRYILLL